MFTCRAYRRAFYAAEKSAQSCLVLLMFELRLQAEIELRQFTGERKPELSEAESYARHVNTPLGFLIKGGFPDEISTFDRITNRSRL